MKSLPTTNPLHELPLIANTVARKRLYEMNVVISDTAEYGNYLFANAAVYSCASTSCRRCKRGSGQCPCREQGRGQPGAAGRQRGDPQSPHREDRPDPARLYERHEAHRSRRLIWHDPQRCQVREDRPDPARLHEGHEAYRRRRLSLHRAVSEGRGDDPVFWLACDTWPDLQGWQRRYPAIKARSSSGALRRSGKNVSDQAFQASRC